MSFSLKPNKNVTGDKRRLPDSLKTHRTFQMLHLSDHLVKEIETVHDSRTTLFKPDQWQTEFMTAIDAKESILIMAPTSSGKTFASFYAMEQVIRSDDADSVLVYVSPTKALVNQTAYAIMDKFGKYALPENKQLCGVFTRDFRNNMLACKVLVTVPQCLSILIMNVAHMKWTRKISYVVFDEIHTMGGESDAWEQLFLLTNFPYIALSATISNANNLYNWLNDLEKTRFVHSERRKVRLISYSMRHNDLKKFVYTNKDFKAMHPVGCLNISTVIKHDSLPSDLHLSAKETIQLYEALLGVYPDHEYLLTFSPETTDLLKTNALESLFITRNSVKKYEVELKNLFLDLVLNGESKKANKVVRSLEVKFDADEFYPKSVYYSESKPALVILFSNAKLTYNMHYN